MGATPPLSTIGSGDLTVKLSTRQSKVGRMPSFFARHAGSVDLDLMAEVVLVLVKKSLASSLAGMGTHGPLDSNPGRDKPRIWRGFGEPS